MMDDQWAPSVGDRVYIQQEQRAGHVVSIVSQGDTELYLVEVDPAPGASATGRAPSWGYDPPEQLSCTIDELTAN